jgi:hypothetical protein
MKRGRMVSSLRQYARKALEDQRRFCVSDSQAEPIPMASERLQVQVSHASVARITGMHVAIGSTLFFFFFYYYLVCRV